MANQSLLRARYYVGIIDILTEYGTAKKAEQFAKMFHPGVSVQEPQVRLQLSCT